MISSHFRQSNNIFAWAHLNWYRTGSVDEGASGQPPSSTWISQKGDGGQTGWEHAGTNWREHSGWTPSDLLGLMRHQRDKEISAAQKSDYLIYQNVFEDLVEACSNIWISDYNYLALSCQSIKTCIHQILVVFHQQFFKTEVRLSLIRDSMISVSAIKNSFSTFLYDKCVFLAETSPYVCYMRGDLSCVFSW